MTSTFFGFTVALSTSESSCIRGRALRRAALSAIFRYSGPNHTWLQDGYAPSNIDLTSADLPEPDSPKTTVTRLLATAAWSDAFSAVRGTV
ncbi:hypothetical protein D3C79_597140 [compost metagenome]